MSDPLTAMPPTHADLQAEQAATATTTALRDPWPPFHPATAFLEGWRYHMVTCGPIGYAGNRVAMLLQCEKEAIERYGDPLAAPHVPTPTAESMMTITDRLRGHYRIPITDGLGPVGGDNLEPGNALEYVRQFWTPPIQHEAAAIIDAFRHEVTSLRAALQRLGVPDGRTRFVVVTTELVDDLKRRPSVPVTIAIDERDHGELSFVLRSYQPTPVGDADVVAALLDFQEWTDDDMFRQYAERAVALAHSNTRGLRRALEGFARRHPDIAATEECPYPSDDVCDAIKDAIDDVANVESWSDPSDVRRAIRAAFASKPVGGA